MHKTRVRTSPLGGTGMRISRVGFGAWAIGGGGWESSWDRSQTTSPSPRSTGRSTSVDPILAAAALELTDEDVTEIETQR